MEKVFSLLKHGLLIFCLCFVIAACSKITTSNFQKVQQGMTMEQVIEILGEPTSVESVDIAGIQGASATWKNQGTIISIQFVNGKVTIKSLTSTQDNHSA